MGKEIETKDAEPAAIAAGPSGKDQEGEGRPDEQATVSSALDANLALLERAVRARDTRLLIGRLLRQTAAIRKRLSHNTLVAFVRKALPPGSSTHALLTAQLDQVADCCTPPCTGWTYDLNKPYAAGR